MTEEEKDCDSNVLSRGGLTRHYELARFQCHLLAAEKINTWNVFSSGLSGEGPDNVLTAARGNRREPPRKARTKIKKRKSGRGARKQWLWLLKRLVWMLRRQQFYQSRAGGFHVKKKGETKRPRRGYLLSGKTLSAGFDEIFPELPQCNASRRRLIVSCRYLA